MGGNPPHGKVPPDSPHTPNRTFLVALIATSMVWLMATLAVRTAAVACMRLRFCGLQWAVTAERNLQRPARPLLTVDAGEEQRRRLVRSRLGGLEAWRPAQYGND